MKTVFFICVLIVSIQSVSGQIETTFFNDSIPICDDSEMTYPMFIGGQDSLFKIISNNIAYPINSELYGIEGKVLTQFTIDTLGSITNIKVIKGINEEIDKEAIRLVSLLKGWTIGTQHGKKVPYIMQLPLDFHIEKE